VKILYLFVLGLAAIYLVVWQAGRMTSPPQAPTVEGSPVVLATGDQNQLENLARDEATNTHRIGANAKLQPSGAPVPAFFKGDRLEDATPFSKGSIQGAIVTFDEVIGDKTVSQLTYHVVLPDKVVLVKQVAK
jgi:hypothetical protein